MQSAVSAKCMDALHRLMIVLVIANAVEALILKALVGSMKTMIMLLENSADGFAVIATGVGDDLQGIHNAERYLKKEKSK